MLTSPLSAEQVARLLRQVQKPGRYLGAEVNAVRKDPSRVRLRIALVFPDVYEMGESHVGLKILYKILNDHPDYWAERVYAPWPDMEQALRQEDLPLFSLESRTPLDQFDLVGITLPYELTYTNVLTVLERGRIPLYHRDRSERHPVILAGGTCAFNPEPLADFLDTVLVGDGEEAILRIAQSVLEAKEAALPRAALWEDLARIEGLYVPSLFEVDYAENGVVSEIRSKLPGVKGVSKATVINLDSAAYPTAPVVPNIPVIHDRVGVEVQRGCVRACRFCQAGYIYRPERQRSPQTVQRIVAESLANTGQEDVSLLSLSIGDYGPLVPLLDELNNRHGQDRVAVSLPATRTETLTPEVIQQIKRIRATGFTIAPEAGTPRMRRIINKGNEREDLMRAVENVFSEGWRLIKFYYMCGLPLEREADVLGIAEEATMALAIGRKYTAHPKIHVSVSSFVPKPFTPFQWEPQLSREETHRLHALLRNNLQARGLVFKHHDVEMSYLEGVFSRGDRRLSQVLYRAWELGARFDEWHELFDFGLWEQAFRDTGLDPDFYVSRRRDQEEILPWDHLFIQMKKDFLWEELTAAHDLAFAEDCSTDRCTDCGVCDFRKVKNVNYEYLPESKKIRAHSTRRRLLKDVAEQELTTTEFVSRGETVFETRTKLRIRYSKLGEAAFLSHLELMSLLRRAMARARIPVGFSQGFHPQMLLSMGPAQPLGQESEVEFFDIELTQPMDLDTLRNRVNETLPAGLQISEIQTVAIQIPSLNGTLREQAYEIQFHHLSNGGDAEDQLMRQLETLRSASEWKILRRREKQAPKPIDIRPYIKELEWMGAGKLRLVTHFGQSSGTIKPLEVIEALLPDSPEARYAASVRKVNAVYA